MKIPSLRPGAPVQPKAPSTAAGAAKETQPSLVDLVKIGFNVDHKVAEGVAVFAGVTVLALTGSAEVAAIGAALGAVCPGLFGAALAWTIDRMGVRDSQKNADCALVLGCGVGQDGKPLPSLEARVHHAADLLNEGRVEGILFTGGVGKSGFAESESARQLALDIGVSPDKIAIENQSKTTWENFLFATPVMEQNGWKSALICTDPYHENRSVAMGKEQGLDVKASPAMSGPAVTDPDKRAKFVEREVVSTYKYWGHRLLRATHLEAPAEQKSS